MNAGTMTTEYNCGHKTVTDMFAFPGQAFVCKKNRRCPKCKASDEAFVDACEAREYERIGNGFINNLPAIRR